MSPTRPPRSPSRTNEITLGSGQFSRAQDDPGWSCHYSADNAGRGIALADNYVEQRWSALRSARDKQPAGGLGIAIEVALPLLDALGKGNAAIVAQPIAA